MTKDELIQIDFKYFNIFQYKVLLSLSEFRLCLIWIGNELILWNISSEVDSNPFFISISSWAPDFIESNSKWNSTKTNKKTLLEFYRYFLIKPSRAKFWKQKLLQIIYNHARNHPRGHGHPPLSFMTPDSSIRTPVFLTKITA